MNGFSPVTITELGSAVLIAGSSHWTHLRVAFEHCAVKWQLSANDEVGRPRAQFAQLTDSVDNRSPHGRASWSYWRVGFQPETHEFDTRLDPSRPRQQIAETSMPKIHMDGRSFDARPDRPICATSNIGVGQLLEVPSVVCRGRDIDRTHFVYCRLHRHPRNGRPSLGWSSIFRTIPRTRWCSIRATRVHAPASVSRLS